ncbi:MAG: septum formation initiator family protein [Ignavibacteriales bacterium]|nr:septum formation initiator family protein [Ignavibacteriales bacterium]
MADDRRIYTGGLASDPDVLAQRKAPKSNRKTVRRRHSTFNIVGLFFGIAIVCLLYTSNIIAVNQLSKEINDLRVKHTTLVNQNGMIQAEIKKKSTRGRIASIASEQLGMVDPSEPPGWFDIDEQKLYGQDR